MDIDVIVRGTGRFVPERVLTNDDFAQVVETSDEWITARTGIKIRHFVSPGETNSLMAAAAARQALEMAGAEPSDVELIIVPTVTAERIFPATASIVQARLGATKAACLDMVAACSGFIYALSAATAWLRSGEYKNALVIGSEVMSALENFTDRNVCVLFGDAAAAVYLQAEPRADRERGVLHFDLGSDGTLVPLLYQKAGGSAHPPTFTTVLNEEHFITMQGQEVFKRAVRKMDETARTVVAKAGHTPDEIDWFIAHQANSRIVEAAGRRLGVPPEKVPINIDHFGNTTSASIPLLLDELNREGKLKAGHKVVLFAFGAGLTWASAYLVWGY